MLNKGKPFLYKGNSFLFDVPGSDFSRGYNGSSIVPIWVSPAVESTLIEYSTLMSVAIMKKYEATENLDRICKDFKDSGLSF